jgi:tetratricopeptide (TPR) repeat protein
MNDTADVSELSPWPGLNAFAEDQQSFFHGRDAEADDLFQHVKRQRSTVLFGQSGLGKTSLLRAGLFPRLRPKNFLPIALRPDYSSDRPSPVDQIKDAVQRAITSAGLVTDSLPTPEETLWEYFHRPETAVRTPAGVPVAIVLVFDQFEELFTRGLTDVNARSRRDELLRQLGDLIESRVPAEVERKFEQDDSLVDRFRFENYDLRVLFCLREDFLPDLESLRPSIPSLGENRLRLTPMNGEQALQAVVRPGRGLVSDKVAVDIVRFVAAAHGTEKLNQLQADPALLSLFCRALNERRLELKLPQISDDLVAGNRDSILRDFYERCFHDLPAIARTFVEDKLLTDAGQRQMLPRTEAEKWLSRPGVPPTVIDVLIARRLLHVEERFNVPYLELTHDRLTGIVEQSRLQRRQVEAVEEGRAAQEKLRAEAAEKVRAAQDKLRISRRRLAIMTVLAALAAVAAGFAIYERQVAIGHQKVALDRQQEADAARQLAVERQKEADAARQVAIEQQKLATQRQTEAESERQVAVMHQKEAERQKDNAVRLVDLEFDLLLALDKYYRENPEFLEGFAQFVNEHLNAMRDRVDPAKLESGSPVQRLQTFLVVTAAGLKQKLIAARGTNPSDDERKNVRESCQEAFNSVKRLAQNKDFFLQRSALVNVVTIAATLKANGDFGEALSECGWATEFLAHVAGDDKDKYVRSETRYLRALFLAVEAEILVARAAKSQGAEDAQRDRQKAADNYQRGIEYAQQAFEIENDPKFRRYIADAWDALGGVWSGRDREEDLEAARNAYSQAKDIRVELWRKSDSIDGRRAVGAAFANLGWIEKKLKQLTGARQAYDNYIRMRRGLVRDRSKASSEPFVYDDDESQRALAVALKTRGDLEREIGDKPAAKPFYDEAKEIAVGLTKSAPGEAKYHQLLATTWRAIGRLHKDLDELDLARTEFTEALAAARDAEELDPKNNSIQSDVGISYQDLGDLDYSQNKFNDALPLFEKTLEIDHKLASGSPDNRVFQRNLSIDYDQLGNVLVKQAKPADARRNFEQSLKIRERLLALDPDSAEAQQDMSYTENKLGELCQKQKNWSDARHFYELSLELRKRAVSARPNDLDAQRALTVGYVSLAEVCVQENKLDDARRFLADALRIRRQLAEKWPTNGDNFGSLAWMEVVNGNAAAAIAAAQHGLKLNPNADWIAGNLADGYLLAGQFDKAEQTYLAYKNKPTTGRTMREMVAEDFALLRKLHLVDERQEQEMQKIEHLLAEPVPAK